MRLDLHIHTLASDGAWSPEEVVDGAVEGGLDAIAIADHDTVASVQPAREAARGRRLEVIPAAELSSTWRGEEIHVLGYFLDLEAASLRGHESRAKERRMSRMAGMVERLGDAGIEVELEAVLEAAGPRRFMVGRPHLARVLVDEGHAESVPDAFDRLIGDEHPAFIPTDLGDPTDAVRTVLDAGGLAVWAHPWMEHLDELLPVLVDAGLGGLEGYRPRGRHGRRLREEAASRGLVVTGGSDWHDPDRHEPLGTFAVTAEEVAEFLEVGGL